MAPSGHYTVTDPIRRLLRDPAKAEHNGCGARYIVRYILLRAQPRKMEDLHKSLLKAKGSGQGARRPSDPSVCGSCSFTYCK
jgi:hypothetical protein